MITTASPLSAQTHERATDSMPGGNTRHSVFFQPHPLYAVSAQGCRLTDADGVTRIDCINNMSALVHGHGFMPVVEAVRGQVNRLLSTGMPTLQEVALAERLCNRVASVEKIRFCTSGTESIMFALRAARALTGRNIVAKAEGAYHGSYDAMEFSLTPLPDAAGSESAPKSVSATPGLTSDTPENTIVLPFNNADATREIITRNRDKLAAIIIDPCISRMGFVSGDPHYLEMVRELCTQFGIVLIYDEVFSFRIHHGGAQAAVGIEPDLSTFGKVIGGGMPIGAVGGKNSFMSVFDQLKADSLVEHSGTHFANPVSMVAGAAALDALDQDCLNHLENIGAQLREGINERFLKHRIAGHAAGRASLVCAVFASEPVRNYRDFLHVMLSGGLDRGLKLHRAMLERGAHIVPGGGMILSSVMTPQDIDELLDIFDTSLASMD